MKLLILPSWYYSSVDKHSGIFFKDQAVALHQAGVNVSVLYVDFMRWRNLNLSSIDRILFRKKITKEGEIPTYRVNGFNLISARFEIGKKLWIKLTLELFEYYLQNERQPDLIQAHSYFAGYIASLIKDRYNIPYVLTEHSSNLFKSSNVEWHKKYMKQAFDNAEVLTGVSDSLVFEMKKMTTNPISVVPNFIDTNFFSPLKTKVDRKIILTIGNLIDIKNHKMLIEAFHKSKLYEKGWKLWIGGKGKLKNKLEIQIKTLKMSKFITLLGQLNRKEVKDVLRQASFFVLPSKAETFGVVIIEAMAVGLPILVTKCGGPETTVNSTTGIVVRNNTEALTKGIIEMSKKYKNFRQNAIISNCKENYSNQSVTQKLKQIYASII